MWLHVTDLELKAAQMPFVGHNPAWRFRIELKQLLLTCKATTPHSVKPGIVGSHSDSVPGIILMPVSVSVRQY